jgi:hypothetical protein
MFHPICIAEGGQGKYNWGTQKLKAENIKVAWANIFCLG